MSNKDEPIDVAAELERLEAEGEPSAEPEGSRGASILGSRRRAATPGAKAMMSVLIVVALAVGGAFTWKALSVRSERAEAEKEKNAEADVVKNRLPALKVAEPAPEPVLAAAASAPSVAQVPPLQPTPANFQAAPPPGQKPPKTPAELLQERRLATTFGESENAAAAQAPAMPNLPNMPNPAGGNPLAALAGGGRGGGLGDKLQPMQLTPAVATRITNPDYVLTMGTPLDCILQTKIVSTVPGLIECYFDRDVYSASSRVVLLDAQTKLVGRYESGIKQGDARIFVAWGRAETPNHVIVNLDSPATGPLGEGGIGGYVDTHFWKRFGGAIMLSLIDDFAGALTTRGNGYGSNNQISFGNTSDAAQEMAGKALENSINIPPTLEQLHGKRVQVMLARDLDFREVYELRAK